MVARTLTMSNMPAKYCVLFGLLTTLSACVQQQPVFYWGGYEEMLYNVYIHPEDAQASAQIEILTQTIERAATNNSKIAPGIYAHLAHVYQSQGQADRALEYYLKEKQLFPEAAVFIDHLTLPVQDDDH